RLCRLRFATDLPRLLLGDLSLRRKVRSALLRLIGVGLGTAQPGARRDDVLRPALRCRRLLARRRWRRARYRQAQIQATKPKRRRLDRQPPLRERRPYLAGTQRRCLQQVPQPPRALNPEAWL